VNRLLATFLAFGPAIGIACLTDGHHAARTDSFTSAELAYEYDDAGRLILLTEWPQSQHEGFSSGMMDSEVYPTDLIARWEYEIQLRQARHDLYVP